MVTKSSPKRGRKTITDTLKAKWDVTSIWAKLSEVMGDEPIATWQEAHAHFVKETGIEVCDPVFRTLVKKGVRTGQIRKGTVLHSLTLIKRGRKPSQETESVESASAVAAE